jgi:hypothetical protein
VIRLQRIYSPYISHAKLQQKAKTGLKAINIRYSTKPEME